MNTNIVNEMLKYAHSLASLGMGGADGVIAARADETHVLVSAPGEAFAALSGKDISEHALQEPGTYPEILRIFAARPDLRGLLLLDNPYSRTVSETKRSMRVSLDDTAQIAGGRIRKAASRSAADVLPCIRKNFGCFIAGYGQLTVGRSLHEAYVAALVLAKGAQAEVQAVPFGGAKPLSALDCAIMRTVYLKKYSKMQEQSL